MKDRYVVIVDGYSSGNFLAPAFKGRGFKCIHVQSTEPIFPILKPSFIPADYEQNFASYEFSELVKDLSKKRIEAVLPGTETGVPLADRLSEALGVPSNGTAHSACRRNKYEMIEAARRKDLPVARQVKAKSAEEILRWRSAESLERIVVKPLESAGTDSVRVCGTDQEIQAAFDAIFGKTNLLGLVNDCALAQELLVGTEYFINSVSREGRHRITDIWKHVKRPLNGRDFVYDCAELCSSTGEIETQLSEYLYRVLDCMGVRFGPAHTEIMWTGEGPRLIEMGTRIQGMSVPSLNEACAGHGPIDLTLDAYIEPGQFERKTEQPYRLRRSAMRVNLLSHREGRLKSFAGDAALRELPSFFFLRWIKSPGMQISPTVDYFTVPGFVLLVHPNPEQLQKDYQTIRQWEAEDRILEYES